VPLPEGFASYAWALTADDVAARHGLRVEQVLKFDQNTPPLPGVPLVPLARSFATLNEYPDGLYPDLRKAAASYVGAGTTWEQIVVGAGADDLIMLCARTFLGPGQLAAVASPTYSFFRIATQLAGAETTEERDEARLFWCCNPNNPTGEVTGAADLVELARAHPDVVVVVDEAYVEFGTESVVPFVAQAPNMIVLRTLSKAFGFASLRVGYAIAFQNGSNIVNQNK